MKRLFVFWCLIVSVLVSVAAYGQVMDPSCIRSNPNFPNPNATREELANPENWPSEWYSYDGNGKPSYRPDWLFLSFIPASASAQSLRQEEFAMGSGINADRAWQMTLGSPNVTIAVLDSGIRWEDTDLTEKFFLNLGELPPPQNADGKTPTECRTDGTCPCALPDPHPYDMNCDGIVNVVDYAYDPRLLQEPPERECNVARDCTGKKLVTPEWLIVNFSDGVDDDNNGYIDDISGWDFFWNDNDPYDDTCFGHGTGEAKDSTGQINNGMGEVGVCPKCRPLMVRVGDSFICDVNQFAGGVVYAVDMGASVIQEALGTINWTQYAQEAMNYAWDNGVIVVASAADETSYHHNVPAYGEHTLYVHAIVPDADDETQDFGDYYYRYYPTATTFLNFNNCTNFGGHLVLSTSGNGCSSEATGRSSGHAGMIYSYALEQNVAPPLTAAEVNQIMMMSSDDINIEGSESDPTKFPSGPGWDSHFGYGRNNVYNSLMMIKDNKIPTGIYIEQPLWFETLDPVRTPNVEVTAQIDLQRYDSYDWVLEWAPNATARDEDFKEIAKASDVTKSIKGKLTDWDIGAIKDQVPGYIKPSPESQNSYAVTIRLRVYSKKAGLAEPVMSDMRKSIFIHHDPDMVDAFPIWFGASGEASPKIADIDGDCVDEVVYPSSDGHIYVFGADGIEKEGWPYAMPNIAWLNSDNEENHLNSAGYKNGKVKNNYKEAALSSCAIGDLDGDGSKTLDVIAATTDGTLVALDYKGDVLWKKNMIEDGWPVASNWYRSEGTSPLKIYEMGFFASPVLYDMNGDGKLEIIIGGLDGYLYMFDYQGKIMNGFPVQLQTPTTLLGANEQPRTARLLTTAAVGDVDGDGEPEIVMGSNEKYNDTDLGYVEGRAYVVKADGTYLTDWPIKLYGQTDILPYAGEGIPFSAALADINRDEKLDIAITAIASVGAVYDYKGNKLGKLASSPSAYGANATSKIGPAAVAVNSASFGDLDGRLPPELVNGTMSSADLLKSAGNDGVRHDFDHQVSAWGFSTDPSDARVQKGTMLPGFPQKVEDYQFFMNYVIADIDGDENTEAVSGTGGYQVNAFRADGSQPDGWPKFTGGWTIAAVALGDIDDDGLLEVVAATREGWFFAWNTASPDTARVEWASFHHDIRNTGNYHESVSWRASEECPTGKSLIGGYEPPEEDGGSEGEGEGEGEGEDGGSGTADGGTGDGSTVNISGKFPEVPEGSNCGCRVR